METINTVNAWISLFSCMYFIYKQSTCMKKWWATIQALKVILSFLEEFYFKYIIHFFDSFFHGLVDIFVNSLSNFYAKFFIDILFCREINSLY